MDSNVPLYFTANTQDFAFHIALDAPKHPHHLPRPVYVRDPPRERLPAASDVDAWGLGIDSRLALVRDDPDIDFYTDLYAGTPKQRPGPMAKKRRSLQQILVPNFLQGSSTSTPSSPEAATPTSPTSSVGNKRFSRLRAHSSATPSGRWGLQQLAELPPPLTPASTVGSPRSSSPPSFLLDDDPFANLTAGPSVSRNATPVPAPPPPPSEEIPLPETPRSPLMPTVQEIPIPRASSTADKGEKAKIQPVPRAFTGQRLAPVAAHRRPAFRSRPSLPSLSTLSQMNVVLTKKVRKGRVGAGLPFEPWDNPDCELPPRVLQDISGTSTQSLPPGTQPLLPSQLVGLAATNPASASDSETDEIKAPQLSHTLSDGPSSASAASPIDEVSTTPNAFSQHIPLQDPEPSLPPNDETYLLPSSSTSTSDSGHRHELVDNYYSRSSSDLGHEEEEENARHRTSDDGAPFSVYNQYSSYTDFDTDTTTTASTSCDELSPPPSSRVSSLDLPLPPTLSRSISSVSVSTTSSQRSVENAANRDSTHARDGHATARSSSEYSDSLRSPLDSDNQCPSLVSSEFASSTTSTMPPPMSPMTLSASVQPHSTSTQQLSPALSTSSIGSSGYFLPPFSSIYAQESTGLGLVANWRDQFGMGVQGYSAVGNGSGYGMGPGLFLSDLELLSEPSSLSLAIPEEDSEVVQAKYPPPIDRAQDSPHSGVPGISTSTSSSSFGSSEEAASSSSESSAYLTTSPPSLPTQIPSPTKSGSHSQHGYGHEDGVGFPQFVNSKNFVASPVEDVDGIAWPSSADTVRQAATSLIRREMSGSEGGGHMAAGGAVNGAVNNLAADESGEWVPEEVVDGDGDSDSNSNGAVNGKGSAAFSGGGAVMMMSMTGEESHSSRLGSSRSSLSGVALNESDSESEARGQAQAEPQGEQHSYQQPFLNLNRDYHHYQQDYHQHQHQDYYDHSISTSASSSSQNLLSSSSGSSRTQSVFSIDSEDLAGMVGYQAPRTSAVSYGDERWSRGSKAVDGSGWEGSSGNAASGGGYGGRSQSNNDYSNGASTSSGWYGQQQQQRSGFGRSGGGGGGDDDDGRDDRRRQRRLHLGPEATTTVGTGASDRDDDNDDSADEYGPPAAKVPATAHSWNAASRNRYTSTSQMSSPSAQATRFPISSTATSSDDDDVPLAQRIPTALTAQKSIRRQVREERQIKKLERAATTASKTTRAAGGSGSRAENQGRDREWEAFSRERHATLRPARAGAALPAAMPVSSSQEAAMHATLGAGEPQLQQQQQAVQLQASVPVGKGRQRTMTMPSKPSPHNPFSAEDLAKRLQNVQIAAEQAPLPTSAQQSPQLLGNYPVGGARASFETPERSPAGPTRGRSMKDYGRNDPYANSPSSPLGTTLRSRSIHNADRESQRRALDEVPPPPPYRAAPVDNAEQRIALSRSQSRVREDVSGSASQAHSPQAKKRSLSISRPATAPHAHTYEHGGELVPPVPPLPSRQSIEEGMAHQQQQHHVSRKLLRPGTSGGRTSLEGEWSGRSPVAPFAALQSASAGQVVQQRVFVGDMQRFNMVEITNSTTAGDVVEMIDAQGSLKGLVGSGGWMVWEVAQDFGMERPIRSFELLSDVQASWNKDKMVNLFVLKATPLSVPLSRSAIPSSSPMHHGYVEWESKRGKWSKRWMQLREHSLWLSKREGKDEMFLCSLSNFDAYLITRSHRAPKPFAFAVKSTDSLSFFENAADYLHNFSCNEKEGRIWMEKILVARSYVLHQERQVLFNPKAPGGNAAGGLTRSGTRKSTAQRLPAAPLVSVPPPYSVANQLPRDGNVFEPGSLLSKQP